MPRIIFSLLFVCTSFLSPTTYAADSLYSRLGGKPVITRVIDQTIDSVARDPELNQSFDQVNIKRLNEKLVEQICSLTGGGCIYTGDDMKRVHQGLKISEREFYALVEALRKALDGQGVGEREKNELLSLLAPMKKSIVEK
ncbi:MAG: group 1 truncated hemoglobin [Thiobacillus sp.]|nr:group 1 truncated hemoglobin [Thiobacillus sp.]